MDTEELNTILAIVAIGGGIGNVIVWSVNAAITWRLQVAQKKDAAEQQEATRKLAEHTSNLEHRVQLLSTHLDQRIKNLDRASVLINLLIIGSAALQQKNRSLDDKLHQSVTRKTALPELQGLIFTIGDSQLEESYRKLGPVLSNPIWAKTWNRDEYDQPLDYDVATIEELIRQQSEHTQVMHQRILELKKESTLAETRA